MTTLKIVQQMMKNFAVIHLNESKTKIIFEFDVRKDILYNAKQFKYQNNNKNK